MEILEQKQQSLDISGDEQEEVLEAIGTFGSYGKMADSENLDEADQELLYPEYESFDDDEEYKSFDDDDYYEDFDDDENYEYFFADAEDDEDEYLGEDDDYEYFEARGRRKKRKARRAKRREKRQTKKKSRAISRKRRRGARRQKRIVKRIKKAERKGKGRRVSRLKRKSARKAKRIDRRIKRIEKKGTLGMRIGRGLKTSGLAVPRNAYLTLLRINGLGLASQLKKLKTNEPKLYQDAKNKWYKLGGNRKYFDKIVERGSKRKAILAKLRKGRSADGSVFTCFEFSNDDYMQMTGAEIAALVTAAAPIVVSMAQLIKKKPPKADNATMAEIEKDAAEQDSKFKSGQAYEDANPIPEEQRDKQGMPIWMLAAIGVGVVALIGGLYLLFRKK